MKRLERVRHIAAIVEERGSATTEYLAASLGISESSVRRDVAYLEALPQYRTIRRVHGGLVAAVQQEELRFESKLSVNRTLKTAIAAAAAATIADGDNIILDSGTTCFYLAGMLGSRRDLHVVTTDLKVGEQLGRYEAIESNIVGGMIRPGYFTIGGSVAIDTLDRFTAERIFMSVDAVDIDHGITNASEFEVGIKRILLRKGVPVTLLVDRTKIGSHCLYRVAELQSVKTIITNRGLDTTLEQTLRRTGIELVLV